MWRRNVVYQNVNSRRMPWRQSNITPTNKEVCLFTTSLDNTIHAWKISSSSNKDSCSIKVHQREESGNISNWRC